MSYEIDRNPTLQPSLRKMTEKALAALSANSPNGFFLMVEGSRIDMAAHENGCPLPSDSSLISQILDAAAHYHDIFAYNDALEAVIDFANVGFRAVSIRGNHFLAEGRIHSGAQCL